MKGQSRFMQVGGLLRAWDSIGGVARAVKPLEGDMPVGRVTGVRMDESGRWFALLESPEDAGWIEEIPVGVFATEYELDTRGRAGA